MLSITSLENCLTCGISTSAFIPHSPEIQQLHSDMPERLSERCVWFWNWLTRFSSRLSCVCLHLFFHSTLAILL